MNTPREQKTLSQAIRERRATPSFDGTPIPPDDLRESFKPVCSAPSGYNVQPWRFIVVQSEEQKRRLRAAAYNQAKSGRGIRSDRGLRRRRWLAKDLDEICAWAGKAACPRATPRMPATLSELLVAFSSDEMHGWLNKMVMSPLPT